LDIFENPALDFSKNRADGDDILGDAYEYLMRHFATESGKSKGQFYTPAEVSRIMAQILGIRSARTTSDTPVYDPTCGSGSLLLKVADTPGRRALYSNLSHNEELAMKIDHAIMRVRPDAWRGIPAREQAIKQAPFEELHDVDQVERIFLIIKQQKEY
jgi:hypothetical protein